MKDERGKMYKGRIVCMIVNDDGCDCDCGCNCVGWVIYSKMEIGGGIIMILLFWGLNGLCGERKANLVTDF